MKLQASDQLDREKSIVENLANNLKQNDQDGKGTEMVKAPSIDDSVMCEVYTCKSPTRAFFENDLVKIETNKLTNQE